MEYIICNNIKDFLTLLNQNDSTKISKGCHYALSAKAEKGFVSRGGSTKTYS